MQIVKCKCGKEFFYDDGNLKRKGRRKPKCFECEMKPYEAAIVSILCGDKENNGKGLDKKRNL